MVKNVKFLTKQSTYYELQELLTTTYKLMAYPLVDDPCNFFYFYLKLKFLMFYWKEYLHSKKFSIHDFAGIGKSRKFALFVKSNRGR